MEMKDGLRAKLEVFIKKYYQNRLIKGLIYGIGLSLAYFFLLTISEYFGRFNSGVRLVLLIILLSGLLAILAYYILWPVAKLMRLGKRISYDQAARIIGKHFPNIDDKIVNTLQLQSLSKGQNDLIAASVEQRIAGLSLVPFSNAVDFRENRKYWPVLVIPILVFAIMAIAGKWNLIAEGGKRIAEYDKEFLPKAPFDFILKNQELSVEQGADLTLTLGFTGSSLPADVEILMPSGESRMAKGKNGNFNFILSNLQRGFDFRFKAAGFLSQSYHLVVLPVPQVSAFILKVEPPRYTHIVSYETEAKLVQDVPEGSHVTWSLDVKQANQAVLVLDSIETPFTKVQEGNFKLTKQILNSVDYGVKTANSAVIKSSIQGNHLNVIKDEFPRIQVVFHADSAQTNLLYYSGNVSDDYGITNLSLVIKKGKHVIKRSLSQKINGLAEPIGGVLMLDSLVGEQSENASIYFEVGDNDGIHGSKVSRSEEYSISLLGKKEQKELLTKQYDRFFQNSEQDQEDLMELQKRLEEFRKELLEKKSLGYKEKSKLKELLDKQKRLMENRQKNEKMLQDLQKKEDALKPKPEDVKQKEDEINKLKSEKEKKMEDLMKDIEKLMQDLNMEKLMQKLEELQKSNQQEEQTMDRKENLLKDLQFKKDVLEQAKKLDELSKKMDELSRKTDKSNSPEEQAEQKSVEDEFNQVNDKVEKLREQNSQLERSLAEKKLMEKAKEAMEEMQMAQQNMEKRKADEANQNQQNSSKKMEEMSKDLQESLMQMQAQSIQANIKTLRQILENLETLSFDVEDLSNQSKIIEVTDPSFKRLLIDQKRLKDGAKVIEDSLTVLAKKAPQIEQIVFEELDYLKSNLDRGINDLEEMRNAQAAADQQYVMTSANNLALMLDASLKNMQQMMAKMKKGNQQCQKPGNKPSMSSIPKMQGELGKKVEDAMRGKKDGDRGFSKEDLVKILSEQEQLRRAFEKMEEERTKGKEGENGSSGEHQKTIEEMKRLEKDLLSGDLADYKDRIKEIESRLLESEKAERQQRKDEKREAESADNLKQMYQQELEKYLRDKQSINESLYRLPLEFKNYYKNQSSIYFEAK